METTHNTKVSAPTVNPLADFAKQLMDDKGRAIFAPKEIREYQESGKVPGITNDDLYKFIIKPCFSPRRAKYDLTQVAEGIMPYKVKKTKKTKKTNPDTAGAGLKETPAPTPANESKSLKLHTHDITTEVTYVPEKDPSYVKWGTFKDVLKIIESGQFFPVYIAGPSGNGKTFMVEQAAANADRKIIRIQLSPETDEDDLLGGFRLVDGNTVFCKGPVIRAMEEGSVLLLDEIDRATNKIMCLQSVLEGKSVLLKKTGETIYPKPGFQVVATANTRGRGCDDGRYTASSIIDDAFLERFPITINQGWPSRAMERRIILTHMKKFDCMDEDFAEMLADWSQIIHQTYAKDGIDEEVSTRRICHAVQTYSIFNSRKDAVRLICNRFDDDIADSFLDLYTKVDSGTMTPESD